MTGARFTIAAGGPVPVAAEVRFVEHGEQCASLFGTHDPECPRLLALGAAGVFLPRSNEWLSEQCADWGVPEVRHPDSGEWVTGVLGRPSRPDEVPA